MEKPTHELKMETPPEPESESLSSDEAKDTGVEEGDQDLESLKYIADKMNELESFSDTNFVKNIDKLMEDRLTILKNKKNIGPNRKNKIIRQLEQLSSKKQDVMNTLKSRLTDIDALKDYPEDEIRERRTVHYSESDKSLIVFNGTEEKKISIGGLVADSEWGIKYRPAPTVPEDIWRKIRKTCDIKEARVDIEYLFNRELSEITRTGGGSTRFTNKFFETVAFMGNHELSLSGFVAEKMAKNILLKIQYDNSDLGFKIENANAIEDSELKYDFKIRFTKPVRGIAVEPEGMSREEYVRSKHLGIQFSLSNKHKEEIALGKIRLWENKFTDFIKRPVDDITSVVLRFRSIHFYRKWLKAGKPSGGPEQFLSREQKIELFKNATQGRISLTDAEIDKLVI